MPYKYVEKKRKGLGRWDEKKKLEVIQTYILLGQVRLTAATCNLPEVTVTYWKKQKWWKEMEDELRRASKLQLSGKLSEMVNKSLLVLEDRLENGDFLYNARTNEFVRKGISAADASKITAQLIDRTLQIEKAAVPEKINEQGIESRLQQLRQEMLKFAKPPLPNPFPLEVIDVNPTQESSSQIEDPVASTGSESREQSESDSRYGRSSPGSDLSNISASHSPSVHSDPSPSPSKDDSIA